MINQTEETTAERKRRRDGDRLEWGKHRLEDLYADNGMMKGDPNRIAFYLSYSEYKEVWILHGFKGADTKHYEHYPSKEEAMTAAETFLKKWEDQ